MKITLDIPENKYQFFLELIKNLTFIKVEDNDPIPQSQMDEVAQRLDMIENGKMKTRNWNQAKEDIFKK